MKRLTSLAACYYSTLTPSLVTKGLSLGAWVQSLTNAMREALHSPGESRGGWDGVDRMGVAEFGGTTF